MKKSPLPRVCLEWDSLRIYFGPLLHLHLVRSDIRGVHSWYNGEKNYIIEYVFKDGTTYRTEYNDFDKFQAILQRLDVLI